MRKRLRRYPAMFMRNDSKPSDVPLRAMFLVAYAASDLSDDDLASLGKHYPLALEAARPNGTLSKADIERSRRAMDLYLAAGRLQGRAKVLRALAGQRMAALAADGRLASAIISDGQTLAGSPAGWSGVTETENCVVNVIGNPSRRVVDGLTSGAVDLSLPYVVGIGVLSGLAVSVAIDHDDPVLFADQAATLALLGGEGGRAAAEVKVDAARRSVSVMVGEAGIPAVVLTAKEFGAVTFSALAERLAPYLALLQEWAAVQDAERVSALAVERARSALMACCTALDAEGNVLVAEADGMATTQDRVVVAAHEVTYAEVRRRAAETLHERSRLASMSAVAVPRDLQENADRWVQGLIRDARALRHAGHRSTDKPALIERPLLWGLLRRSLPTTGLIESVAAHDLFQTLAKLVGHGDVDLSLPYFVEIGRVRGLTVTIRYDFDDPNGYLPDVCLAVAEFEESGATERLLYAAKILRDSVRMVTTSFGRSAHPCMPMSGSEFARYGLADWLDALEVEFDAVLAWADKAQGPVGFDPQEASINIAKGFLLCASRMSAAADVEGAGAKRILSDANAKFLSRSDKKARGVLNALRRRKIPDCLKPTPMLIQQGGDGVVVVQLHKVG